MSAHSPLFSIDDLHGADLISAGLRDARAERITPEACLISIALPRLLRAGVLAPGEMRPMVEAELILYRLLREQVGNAFSRYQALLRRLIRFEHALDYRQRHLSRPLKIGSKEEHQARPVEKSGSWES